MKILKKSIVFVIAALFSTGLYAQDRYAGMTLGMQFNVGDLGGTILKDGLSSSVPNASLTGASPLTGCNNAGDPDACRAGSPGTEQRLIIEENYLQSLDRSTGGSLFDNDLNGAMSALVVGAFYEQEGNHTFFRIGVNYAQKIMGGYTASELLGVQWYEVEWDYKAVWVPFYFGFKTGIGESASVYAGAGMNYHRGGWDVGGYNFGDFPTYALGGLAGGVGAHTVVVDGQERGGSMFNEAIKYRVNGVGFNVVLGVEKRLDNGNKVFFEVDRLIAGSMGQDRAKTTAASQGLAPFPAYPIVLAGTVFQFGYKIAL